MTGQTNEMNLYEFKRLVDDQLDLLPASSGGSGTEDMFFDKIRSFFPPVGSSQALAVAKKVLHELAVRYFCDNHSFQPYRNIAQALQLALRIAGTSTASVPNWRGAIEAATQYHMQYPPRLNEHQELVSNVRANVVSKSVIGLRSLGYQVTLPDIGSLLIEEAEVARLQSEIASLARSLGGEGLVATALAQIKPTYSQITDRFNLGRNAQQVRLDAVPQVPYAFLYQLGLKYLHCTTQSDVGEAEFRKLINLLTWAVGILDLESDNTFGLMFARSTDILETTRKSLLYDATFCLTQANVNHVRTFLMWLLRHEKFAKLRDPESISLTTITAAAMVILKDTKCSPDGFQGIPPEALCYLTTLNPISSKALLIRVFAHRKGEINSKLTFPLEDSVVDSAFRPLVIDRGGKLLRLPPNLAARAALNAVIEWCRQSWPDSKGFDEALGLAMEQFVRDQFVARGVQIYFGSYGKHGEKGECDLVIKTESHIVFFELKGKVLTRQSRSGDVLKALQDLADSMARPQAQAMTRHAFLKKNGIMELVDGDTRSLIELGSREVLKVSVTRGELLSLHDRPYLWHYLAAGCSLQFDTVDPKQQKKLQPLHDWFKKFKEAAHQAGDLDTGTHLPFSSCWSLSLFQIMLLLERTTSAEDFVRELLRTSRVSISSRDFYQSYEFLLYLQTLK